MKANYRLSKRQWPIPADDRVVVLMENVSGRILVPPDAQASAERGVLVAIGYNAFKNERPGMFNLGDEVAFTRYGGELVERDVDPKTREVQYLCTVRCGDVNHKIVEVEDDFDPLMGRLTRKEAQDDEHGD